MYDRVVVDGGAALQAACRTVTPDLPLQHDQWHLLHRCAQLHGWLARLQAALAARTPPLARQAARLAAGQRRVGRPSAVAPATHAVALAHATAVVTAVSSLLGEVTRLFAVVVEGHRALLTGAERQAELAAALALLDEVATQASAAFQPDAVRIHAVLRDTLPSLLPFVPTVDQVQQELAAGLPPADQALIGWT